MKLKSLVSVLAVAGLVAPGIASATNGYFSHGYGMKAKGRGGVSTAYADDAMGGASNPAKMAFVGDRLDIGVDWFSPVRSAKRTGASDFGMGAQFNGTMDSDSENFFIPEFGYNKMLSSNLALGVTVYGNGGMNTDYQPQKGKYTCVHPTFGLVPADNLLCGQGKLGVNLEQLIIAPTVAYKVNPNHSIGISPLFGYQRFAADGLQAFGVISTNPNNLTNKGHDSASGWGVRVGWMGKLTNQLTVGAAYSSKIDMGSFNEYKGLFAEQGDFDIPANYNIGIAFQATPALNIGLDYQRIVYSDVKAVSNSSKVPGCFPGFPFGPGTGSACLGGSNGIGFGWQDMDVWKLAAEYKYSDKLTLRAGYNHGKSPIRPEDVTFNILAPGVVEDHVTLGFTYGLSPASELTVAYMHAFEKSITGPSNNPYFTGGITNGSEEIKMYQNSLGVAYSMKF